MFIQKAFAQQLAKRFQIKIRKTPDAIKLNSYEGTPSKKIQEVLTCSLDIDGRRFTKVPMIVLEMQQPLILGRKWFSRQDILIDCKRKRLIWPEERQDYIAARELQISKKSLDEQDQNKIDPTHQADVERREKALDRAIAKDPWKPSRILQRQSQESNDRVNMRIMQRELALREPPVIQSGSPKGSPVADNRSPVSVCASKLSLIGAVGFHVSLKNPKSEFFTSSLYEINRIIADRSDGDPQVDDLARVPKVYHDLIKTFSKKESDKLPPHREYDHKIKLTEEVNSLKYHPLYHMTVEELKVLKDWITENLDKGFIEHSSAPFAAPVLFIKKPNGSLRLCIDYRKLNAITEKDRYPLPLLDETLARISRAKIFTKLDIRQAFNRIRMDPQSEELTSFRTRYGQYKCKVLPFGLTNGPATYQRYMNNVLFDYLDDFCTAYLDDILIYSEDPLEHEAHVRKVLERLRDAGLQADIKKCEFGVTKTKYLGFIISTDGIQVDPEKISAIKEWQYPTSVKGVQAFLGFCNFYRRFIEKFGRIAKPLTQCTQKDRVFDFDAKCREAFERLKIALCSAPVLCHYHPERESKLETDSSDGTVGGVFSQLQEDGLWRPVAYFSKTMLPTECNYTIHDKELLAIVRAFEQWRAELEALQDPLKVYSDHKALEYFMTKKDLSARQARWAELLSRFHFKIQYHTAAQNQKADALTRREEDMKVQRAVKKEAREQVMLPKETLSEEVQAAIARGSSGVSLVIPPEKDKMLAPIMDELAIMDRLLQANRNSGLLDEQRESAKGECDYTMSDGLLLAKGRLVVPDEGDLRVTLIREVHEQKSTAHPGRKKTLRLLRDRYYWKNMSGDIERYLRNCHMCRRTHVPRDKTPGLLHPLPIPSRPWQHISMDFKSFPVSKRGFDCLLVVVDRLGKRPISIPCHKTIDARGLAELFIPYIWRYYGPPDTIVSDRGPQFISAFWNEFCKILGVKLKLSTAEQPQTDGQTEIVNQYIDQRLRPHVAYYQDDWDLLVPVVDFAQASLVHDTTGQSAFQTELAYEPRTSFDWSALPSKMKASERLNREEARERARKIEESWQLAQGQMKEAQERYTRQANKKRREVNFDVGDKVWVSAKTWRTERPSKKLDYQQAGPFKILAKEGHSFRLDLPGNIKVHPVIHASKLRKDPDDPLLGQRQEEPLPMVVENEQEWEVEKVLGVRVVRRQLRYKIQWVGFDLDTDEYLPEDLAHAPQALRDFHQTYPDLPGPPRNLDYWLECAEKDIYPEKRADDNIAKP